MADTLNRFLVGGRGEQIIVGNPNPLMIGVTREHALNLAAWLVVLADHSTDHADFTALVREIEST